MNTIETDLSQKSPAKLLWQYSGPAVIESVAVSLYNIVDSMFVGKSIGAMALAALAVALPLMNLVIAFCTLVSAGGAAIISIYLGRKDFRTATSTVNNVMLLCLVHALVFGVAMLVFLDPILTFFGATDATIGFARRYMRIILYGTPISYVFIGLNNMMRATGYPRKAMISALLSVVVNVALCPLFIDHLGWGVEGAALATVCGQGAAFVWVLSHFLSPKSLIHFDLKDSWFTKAIIKKVYAIGLSPFLMNVAACVVVVFLNKSLLHYGGAEGNLDIGAYGILNRTTMVFVMVVFGVTMGMQPILGYNYGAGQWKRVVKTLKLGIWVGLGVTTIGWLLTELCPDVITEMFTNNRELLEITRRGFRIYFIVYPVVGVQIVIQNFFQYIDHPMWSIALSLTRQLIYLVPLIAILPEHFGVPGIWGSMAGADMLAFITALVVLLVMLPRIGRKFEATHAQAAASVTAQN